MQTPTREHAVENAERRLGLMEGGCVGPSVVYEVLAREDYPERARQGDYRLSVVFLPKKRQKVAQTRRVLPIAGNAAGTTATPFPY